MILTLLEELIQSKQIEKAMQQFQKQEDKMNEYEYSKFAKHLHENGYTLESIKVLKKAVEKFPHNPYILKSIVSKIYQYVIVPYYAGKRFSHKEYMATIHYIDRILNKDLKSDYSYIYFKHVDYLLKQRNPDKQAALACLRSLDATTLKRTPFQKDGKSFPSDYEKWVVKMANLQFDLKLYEDCIQTIDRAFSPSQTIFWHNRQDIWLQRLKARSLHAIRKTAEAIRIYESLLIKHPTWFMYHELANFHRSIGNKDTALYYVAKSCLSRDADPAKCGKLYQTMYELLQTLGNDNYYAFLHIAYIIEIYKTNRFQIANTLINTYNRLSSKYEQSKNIKTELEEFWLDIIYRNTEKQEGTIISILPNGKAGFIEYAGKEKIYFKVSDVRFPKKLVKKGKKVTFVISESFDYAKNRPSKIAEYICEGEK